MNNEAYSGEKKIIGNAYIEEREYWLNKFSGEITKSNFPYDFNKKSNEVNAKSLKTKFETGLFERLIKVGTNSYAKMHVILSTALAILTHKYTGNEDIILTTPIYKQEVEGVFSNTILPLRSKVDLGCTFKELLIQMRETLNEAQQNQSYPIEALLERLNFPMSNNEGCLFDIAIMIEGIHDKDYIKKINHSIIFCFVKAHSELELVIEYNSNLFKEETIKRITEHYMNIIKTCLWSPEVKISDIDMLTVEEKNRLVINFNNTKTDYPIFCNICELIENQAKKTPNNLAVIFENESLSYKELNEKSNQLAIELKIMGISKGDIVAIIMKNSPELIISILASLKVGAAYLPIDYDYPTERIEYILQDSNASYLLVNKNLKNKYDFFDKVFEFDYEKISNNSVNNIQQTITCEDLAYIIYTSGSTGKPKGTKIHHRALVNYIWWANKVYVKGERVNFPLYSSIAFDLTVTSIFTPLTSGNSIIVYDSLDKELLLKNIIEDNKINVIKLTPTHLHLIKQLDLKNSKVKRFIVGGEALNIDLAQDINDLYCGNVEIYNEYGPTEATVGCMIYKYDIKTKYTATVPIGGPIDNVQIYILDRYFKAVPKGVVGEIYISGDGVSKGYLNKENLTNEKFIQNPFIKDKIMYKTGDCARFLPDGNIEFIGRNDQQVKVRGFRIEIGEIENALLKHKSIKSVVVDTIENKKNNSNISEQYCSECGMPSTYPNIVFDSNGICNMCSDYKQYKSKADGYFKTISDLEKLFKEHTKNNKNKYDCIVLFSGGKDSSYVLYKLVEMGLKVLAFTFDNGFISDTAINNIKNIVDELKVDNVIVTSENTNQIFVESLKYSSNVCNGCFKSILALSTKMAYENDIKYVVTGLSRGQIYEMRLMELYNNKIFDPNKIDRFVLNARKVYHEVDDYISKLLDVDVLKNEEVFKEVEFIDFFRYSDVTKKEIFEYLKNRSVIWSKPSDTGFCSSNCRINDVGIYVHKKERGYHNYALPTCWEVRTKHLSLEDANKELKSDSNNVKEVRKILKEIGYKMKNEDLSKNLVAYYVSDDELKNNDIIEHLSSTLPNYMVPSYFVRVSAMPLTINGKVDKTKLPNPIDNINFECEYVAPRDEVEEKLVEIWKEILGINNIGIYHKFIELGGYSLKAVNIINTIQKVFDIEITVSEIFSNQTISELSSIIRERKEENEKLKQILSEIEQLV